MSYNRNDYFYIVFDKGTDEEAQIRMRERGSVDVTVYGADGSRFRSVFVTIEHLQRSLDKLDGKLPCLSEPNMFIVQEATVEAVQDSVELLWREGFYSRFAAPERPSLKRIWHMILQFIVCR